MKMNKSQKLLAQSEAAQTPLIDLLKNVPKDGRHMYEVHPTEHHNIPYGRLCNEASDEIERLNAEIRRMVEVMEIMYAPLVESVDLVQNDYDTDWRHGIPSRQRQLEGKLEMLEAHKKAIAAFDAWQGGE